MGLVLSGERGPGSAWGVLEQIGERGGYQVGACFVRECCVS